MRYRIRTLRPAAALAFALFMAAAAAPASAHPAELSPETITPPPGPVVVQPGQTLTLWFTVSNRHLTESIGRSLRARCTWGTAALACSPTSTYLSLAPGASAQVGITFTAGPSGTGSVMLETRTSELEEAEGVSVTAAAAGEAPVVDVATANPGTSVERDLCLTVALGDAAASECGDLRLAHALPGVRTMNKDRTPVLLYNAGMAEPHPLVAANVTLPAGSSTPDSVTAVLLVGGAERGRGRWTGDDWSSGQTRRIVVGYAAPDDLTGVYGYRLEVTNWYGATARTAAATGEFTLVNRRWSTFGAGWWLAGFERLHFVPGGQRILWEGGDGSTRVYRPVAGTVDAAGNPTRYVVERQLDRADTLLRIDSAGKVRYVRRQQPGVRVVFGATGWHDSTVNRLGHLTRFTYASGSPVRLASITVPAGPVYSFEYGTVAPWPLRLWRVVLTAGTVQRVATLGPQNGDPRVYSIHDPDGNKVDWGFTCCSTDPRRPLWRRDRRGTVTAYTYGAGGKITGARTYMRSALQPDTADLLLTLRPQETQGMPGLATPGAVDTATVHTWVDGPRGDVADITRYYLDRWGAPGRVVDASLAETRIHRTDARWPVLPTRVEGPLLEDNSRAVSEAVYDGRGNLYTVTEIDPYRDGRNAVTRYAWHPVWGLPTRIVSPEGDSTVVGYHSANGNRLWQQDAGGTPARVTFRYYQGGSAPGLLRAVDGPLTPTDSVEYDALGNVSASVSPLRFRTTILRDALGRDTLVISPIDSAQTYHVRQRNEYDVMGRVRMTEQWGPALPYANSRWDGEQGVWIHTPRLTEAERLSVRSFYDAEGNLLLAERWTTPDSGGIGMIATTWRYDAAGRSVAEVAPSAPGEPVRTDSTVYDHAGNVIRAITRRGHQITMRYDAANRMIERNLPQVSYPSRFDPHGSELRFPLHPNFIHDWVIAAEQSTFGYDAAGNLRTAHNPAARITRRYHRNGLLESDSLHLARYDGAFNAAEHGYGLRYSYDRNGRRLSLEHPSTIAPNPGTTMWTRYGYNLRGQLDSVYTPTGEAFAYEYDAEGRQTTLRIPGGISDTRTYDGESRLLTRIRTGGNLVWSGEMTFASGPYPDHPFQDAYRYDARGKALFVRTPFDSTTHLYSALGTLVKRHNHSGSGPRVTEWMGTDAMGNLRWTRLSLPTNPWGIVQVLRNSQHQTGTGRQVSRERYNAHYLSDNVSNAEIEAAAASQGQWESHEFDPAGNLSFAAEHEQGDYNIDRRTAYYYDAANRLRVSDRRTCSWGDATCNSPFNHPDRGAFEEYRYDALGRRVLVRTRSEKSCPFNDCVRALTRTVWDGDAVLYEIRYPGHTGAQAWEMEQDVGTVSTHPHNNGAFGRVLYVNGAVLDQPLAMLRMDYSPLWPEARLVVPHATWRGMFDQATDGTGAQTGHRDGGYWGGGYPDQCRFHVPMATDECFVIDWPTRDGPLAAFNAHGWGMDHGGEPLPKGWMGQSARGARDGSGLMYRRNRYYDPASGRFTQEDPIGLAGGINLYGYADGDPVNYSDPFGLCSIPTALGGVAFGYAVSRLAGSAYGWREASVDAALGCVGAVGVRALGRVNSVRRAGVAARVAGARHVPQIGRKLDYLFGRATGSAHNVQRSRTMARSLSSIGLNDTPATRQLVTNHLDDVLNDASSIVQTQANGRVVRESLLMGPNGGAKLQTIWEGDRLITMNVFR